MYKWSIILFLFGVFGFSINEQQKEFQYYYFEGNIVDVATENSLIPIYRPFVSLTDSTGEMIYGTRSEKDGSFKMRIDCLTEEKVRSIKVEGPPFKSQVISYMPDSDSLFYVRVELDLDSVLLSKKVEIIYTGNHYVD